MPGSSLGAALTTLVFIPDAAALHTPPLTPETRPGRAKAGLATAAVLLDLTAPAHSTPLTPLHNPEAASLLTLAE